MNKDIIEKIYDNYNTLNKKMIAEMKLCSDHSGITGSHREEMWIEFFERMIPKKFTIAKGVKIIDSFGSISNEVDICIFDNSYTPYIFQFGSLKFIPIEAVAVVIECKSRSWSVDKLEEWCESINKLKTNSSGIARMATGFTMGITNRTQNGTRPIKILASINKDEDRARLEQCFDFIILHQNEEDDQFKLKVPNESKTLGWWQKYLNMYTDKESADDKKEICDGLKISNLRDCKSIKDCKIKEVDGKKNGETIKEFYITNTLKDLEVKDNPVLTLNFQLNQLLIIINNPMLFPHFAYVNMFNKISKKD